MRGFIKEQYTNRELCRDAGFAVVAIFGRVVCIKLEQSDKFDGGALGRLAAVLRGFPVLELQVFTGNWVRSIEAQREHQNLWFENIFYSEASFGRLRNRYP